MPLFIYETHMHTVQASVCGKSPGKDYIQKYIDAGFSGIMITAHFFRGNCKIDSRLPWRQRIELFCRGYEDAWETGYKLNFPVFFGWEEYYEGDEYLVYGLNKQWILEHPEMEHWTRAEQYRYVDALEGINSSNSPEEKARDSDYGRFG